MLNETLWSDCWSLWGALITPETHNKTVLLFIIFGEYFAMTASWLSHNAMKLNLSMTRWFCISMHLVMFYDESKQPYLLKKTCLQRALNSWNIKALVSDTSAKMQTNLKCRETWLVFRACVCLDAWTNTWLRTCDNQKGRALWKKKNKLFSSRICSQSSASRTQKAKVIMLIQWNMLKHIFSLLSVN